MKLHVAYDFLPKTLTANAAVVMDHFGVGFETGRHVIADGLELPIRPGDIVCFTGASGSGKSSLMRAVAEELEKVSGTLGSVPDTARVDIGRVVWLDRLDLGEALLVDGLGLPANEALALLAACGLGEAQLLLRTPAELSDGQRYRYRLAKALAQQPQWIVADEFTAALDRTLAQVIAFNLRKLATRTGVGCLIATTHEDIVADLAPDVHVVCRLDGAIRVEDRHPKSSATSDVSRDRVKKKRHQLRARTLAVPRRPCRLAVLRSVALPQPPIGVRPLRHGAVARRGADRHLRVHHAGDRARRAVAVLRPHRALVAGEAGGAQPATGDAVARGAASDVSGRGDRRGIHPRELPQLRVAVDRDAGGDGAFESVF
jgi:ABC-type lipoprotein export system ATPase subunit